MEDYADNIKFDFLDDLLEEHQYMLLAPSQISLAERPIAGSKRVARYRNEQSHKGSGQLLQSITAQPALSTRSFEELRVECYAQSLIAQGKPPTNTVTTFIPPIFNAYHDETDDILPNEITMAD